MNYKMLRYWKKQLNFYKSLYHRCGKWFNNILLSRAYNLWMEIEDYLENKEE